MATAKTDTRQKLSFGVRTRMFLRFLGMTAILAAGAGAIYLSSVLPNWKPETLQSALKKELGNTAFYGSLMLFGGVLLALFSGLVELLSSLKGGTGGRGAVGMNAAVQSGLAIALVIAINVYAFMHPASFDLTSNRQFTLPDHVVADLQKLKSETTIVVLQQHKTFGQLSAKPDRYDYAAERKVVEKVLDTVDLFRKFGPQFKVVVLDVEEDSFQKKFEAVTKDRPALRDAINTAPENSIFFWSEGKVQRMSFNEFLQLDKVASKKGNGNLVLHPQGIGSLVKRVTAIEEKRPKVAVAVCHEWLTTQVTEGQEQYTLAGLRKSLTEHGFDVVDVVLKKSGNRRGLEAAAFTYQETKLKRLEAALVSAKRAVDIERNYTARLERHRKRVDDVKEKPIADRLPAYFEVWKDLQRILVTAKDLEPAEYEEFERSTLAYLQGKERRQPSDQAEADEEYQQIENELSEIKKQERSIEDLYLSNVKAKFTRMLDECDLLILPRMTIINPTMPQSVIPRQLHSLNREQAEVIRHFMEAGKPVFFCAGPINEPRGNRNPLYDEEVEKLFTERGVEFGNQTVLFNAESKAFREVQGDQLGGAAVKLPPLSVKPPADWRGRSLRPNPVSSALQVLMNSVDQPLDIQIRAPAPVRLSDAAQKKQAFAAEFLWTSAKSWNETYPFNGTLRVIREIGQEIVEPEEPPRLDTESDSADKKDGGGASVERRGPFSIALAAELPLPEKWLIDAAAEHYRYSDLPALTRLLAITQRAHDSQKRTRFIVLGHGGLFSKPELNPATEQLLLLACNWLLKRDERLPHVADPGAPIAIDRPWEYPRVEMSPGTKEMWHWGAFLGLPALCVYLGLVVLMIRKVR